MEPDSSIAFNTKFLSITISNKNKVKNNESYQYFPYYRLVFAVIAQVQ